MYSSHDHVSVCPSLNAHTTVQTRMQLWGMVGGPCSCALLGGFAIDPQVSLLRQHSTFSAHGYCVASTAEWIKMPLGMEVGLTLGHIVLDGTKLPLPQMGTAPNFRLVSVVAKMARWIEMLLGMEVGISPSDIVLDGDPAPPLPKGGGAPNFGSRPSDHYFRSVCWFVCLSVCLFMQSFSQPSLIRFRSNCCMLYVWV